MSVLGNPLLLGDDGYQISRSVRLRSSASSNFSKTFAGAPTSTTKHTYSAWVKRGALTDSRLTLFSGYDGSSTNNFAISFESSGTLRDGFCVAFGGLLSNYVITNALLRDPSAWYHLVVSIDTTQATAANRVVLYINGVQQTSLYSTSYPAQNAAIQFALANANNRIGSWWNNTGYFDGYLTEVNFIDGQALTPSSFGQNDPATGVWGAKKYGGAYGTNGFYLNFKDPSTTTTIGADYSGNGNNWTPNNISVTAGVTYDSMIDVPTMWGDGGNGRGNYCVLNGANNGYGTTTLSQANMYAVLSAPGASEGAAIGTIGMSSGKWYWEINVVSANTTYGYPCTLGISTQASTNGVGVPATTYAYNSKDGNKLSNTGSLVSAAYGATFTAGDLIGVAFDADAGTLTFYKNNTSQGTAFTSIASNTWFARVGSNDGCTVAFNFGQRPFTYTPPTGFKALNTQNLPDSTIKAGNKYFDASLYTGTGAAQNILNAAGFKPDLVWVKSRSGAYNHGLFDSVRGANVNLYSNLTSAEASNNVSGYLTSFNSNGFSATPGSTDATLVNASGQTYVGWQWKANGTAVSNTSGTITSQVNAGTTQGFSVVTYTGTGANATVGHGLGVAPAMYIIKSRNLSSYWTVYHTSLGNNILRLNTTDAVIANSNYFTSAPNSTLIYNSTSGDVNSNGGTYVAYCFAEVAGFSKFGSYTGNDSADGPFVYCGFRPRWVMIKNITNTGSWVILDTSRDTYNAEQNYLFANQSTAEGGLGNVVAQLDGLSNGFKIRANNANAWMGNQSGSTFIFAAFAENPFKNSLAR